MPKPDFFLLLFLAKKTRLFNSFSTSTAAISKEFGVSQQTVSRKLRSLKAAGLITLNASANGCEVSLSKKGIAAVKKHFFELKNFFSAKKPKELEGIVSFGFGEGKYYVSQKPYLKQFKELLGFKPFFGTLNVAVDEEKFSGFLLNSKPVFIEGFSARERDFGSLKAFKIKIFNLPAAIIIPERTRHEKNIAEIIAPACLKKKFGLKQGSRVKIFLA